MPQITVIGIDDEKSSRELIDLAARRLARQLGQPVQTHVTYSTSEALEHLSQQEREATVLVVLDLNLPGDVDGRALGPYLREQYPQIAILPFTADTSPKTLNAIRVNGMPDPVVKPASVEQLAERMAATLNVPMPAGDPLLQAFHADLARKMATMVQRERHPQTVQVALLAHKHVVLAGLKQILAGIEDAVGIAVTVPSGRPDPVIVAARQGKVDLLVCDPEDVDEALAISQGHGIPVLVYASLCDASTALGRGLSIVVEPATSVEWAEAIRAVLRGDRYRPRHLEALLAMLPRDRAILSLLREGLTSEQIADQMGFTSDRLRQRVSRIYHQLNISPVRAALQAWAQEIPEAWLDDLPQE